jgi:hypothetical protein
MNQQQPTGDLNLHSMLPFTCGAAALAEWACAGGITAWHAMCGPTVPLAPHHNRGDV